MLLGRVEGLGVQVESFMILSCIENDIPDDGGGSIASLSPL